MIAQGSVKNRNVGKGSKCKFHISIQTLIIREGGESKAVKLSMPLSIVQGFLAKSHSANSNKLIGFSGPDRTVSH